jgi:hypothetical protein
MRERAGLHGGILEWSGRRNGGTTVTVHLPGVVACAPPKTTQKRNVHAVSARVAYNAFWVMWLPVPRGCGPLSIYHASATESIDPDCR